MTRTAADCEKIGDVALGGQLCCGPKEGCPVPACASGCASDQDCAHVSGRPVCLGLDGGTYFDVPFCGCGSDADCPGKNGNHCDNRAGDYYQGYCGCLTAAECAPGEACDRGFSGAVGICNRSCESDTDCGAGEFCSPQAFCLPRCDGQNTCAAPETFCDTTNDAGMNGMAYAGAAAGVVWCYECLSASDCPAGQGCSYGFCGDCYSDQDCRADEACAGNGCLAKCDLQACPDALVCDRLGTAGPPDICTQCATAADCPYNQGCTGGACGTCSSSNDCPPGSICSNYWGAFGPPAGCNPSGICGVTGPGVCLANCDRFSCPADRPDCEAIPSLSVEHSYCVACSQDSDCADAGTGAWCDVSVNRTYTCQPSPP